MATWFVTGGNGFLGSHLVDALVARGETVRALARDTRRLRWLRRDGVELIPGDLADAGALARGARGADVVVHSAALVRARTAAEIFEVNVEGTRRIVDASLASPTPPRFVLVSSQAAAGPSPNGEPVREADEPKPRSAYGRSKLAAERVLVGRAGELPYAIVRPPAIYGPRDDAFLFLFRTARRLGVLPHPKGARHLSVAHVADVAEGVRLAAENGTISEVSPTPGAGTYFVTDGNPRSMRDVLTAIGASVGRRVRLLDVPPGPFIALVTVWERLARLAGHVPPMTTDRASDATALDWLVSDARARTALGYRSRFGLEAGMTDTAGWYRERKWL